MAPRKRSTPLSLDLTPARIDDQSKAEDLSVNTVQPGATLTDNLGHGVTDDNNSLRGGERGPTLLEDFLLREKISHFDHERIPERVVHARGAGAHGYFVLEKSLAEYTSARVLTEVGVKTPLFTRFSTVAGSRGAADTARDVRGFAVKMYTSEGNWDIVGNNIPVFFIQDAIKFPDLIHSVKPEPHNEIPQGASAHDTFYDFISLTPESMHMLMWVHSDRAIPRSFDMMDGFGIHTFRLINKAGDVHLVKFHFKAVLGAHSLVWDEAQKIAGKDSDFHRRNMWETIDAGGTLEWEFGVQVFTEAQAAKWDFDVIDPTKLVPEDLVPVQRVGRMVLNRNPDNYFAETEQVAFMPTNIVPGIDFSNDPLLQGRLFSYLDTQLSRLGSPNWVELPINRPLAPVHNNQRDGHMRQTINTGRVSYFPNTLGGAQEAKAGVNGYVSYPERLSGVKQRVRAKSFADHYGQARLFWNSVTPVEREHITKSLAFELSNCTVRDIRVRMLDQLEQIHPVLASQVAVVIGEAPRSKNAVMPGAGQDSAAEVALLGTATARTTASGKLQKASGLSQLENQPMSPKGRMVAVLVAPGTDAAQVASLTAALTAAGAKGVIVGPHLGTIAPGIEATKTFGNTDPVLYDAVMVPGGEGGARALMARPEAQTFVTEAYRHAKPIGALGEGAEILTASPVGRLLRSLAGTKDGTAPAQGVQNLSEVGAMSLTAGAAETLATHGILIGQADADRTVKAFVQALAAHRYWGRPQV